LERRLDMKTEDKTGSMKWKMLWMQDAMDERTEDVMMRIPTLKRSTS